MAEGEAGDFLGIAVTVLGLGYHVKDLYEAHAPGEQVAAGVGLFVILFIVNTHVKRHRNRKNGRRHHRPNTPRHHSSRKR